MARPPPANRLKFYLMIAHISINNRQQSPGHIARGHYL
jgi:hypothetical protein